MVYGVRPVSGIRIEVRSHALDVGGDGRVRQKVHALIIQAVCIAVARVGYDTSLHILPKDRKKGVPHCPTCRCQLPDDR